MKKHTSLYYLYSPTNTDTPISVCEDIQELWCPPIVNNDTESIYFLYRNNATPSHQETAIHTQYAPVSKCARMANTMADTIVANAARIGLFVSCAW